MKHGKRWIFVGIYFLHIVAILLVFYMDWSDGRSVRSYQGAEMYMSGSYLNNEEFSERMLRAAARASDFFPMPETVEKENCTLGFYIFDDYNTYGMTTFSFALDRTYADAGDYAEAKRSMEETYPVYESEEYPEDWIRCKIGIYNCYLTETAATPLAFGIVCSCDETQTLRLIYFREARTNEVDPEPSRIQEDTSCPWD